MADKDFEEEMSPYKAELFLARERRKGTTAKMLLAMRFVLSILFLGLAGFLYYLGVSTAPGEKEVALATTNAGTVIVTGLLSFWYNQRPAEI